MIANQPGNSNYSAAPQVTQSTAVTKASQSITFGTIPTQVAGSLSLTVSASSGLPSFASLTTSICTVSGTTATMSAAGTCRQCAVRSRHTGIAELHRFGRIHNSVQSHVGNRLSWRARRRDS